MSQMIPSEDENQPPLEPRQCQCPPPLRVKHSSEDIKRFSNYAFPEDCIRIIRRHKATIYNCTWKPDEDLLITGSGDSTARVWNLNGTEEGQEKHPNTRILCTGKYLNHGNINVQPRCSEYRQQKGPDVTCVDWHPFGEFIATGCYDGYARIWAKHNGKKDSFFILASLGILKLALKGHRGPIYAIKWRGNYLLTCGTDGKVIIWNPTEKNDKNAGEYLFHRSAVFDADWISDEFFASCSVDMTVIIYRLGQFDAPYRTFAGHEDIVNVLKVESSSKHLATGSYDSTVKIWSMSRKTAVHTLEHDQEVNSIQWSFDGKMLASGSDDKTVKLWNAERGECLHSLKMHKEMVLCVAFSPDGLFLASSDSDSTVCIWSVKDGRLLQAFVGEYNDAIYEVSWNYRGDKVAAGDFDGSMILLDLRHTRNREEFRSISKLHGLQP